MYVVSMGLLVAVMAWLVSVYNKLNWMRTQVQEAWTQWSRVTMQRNERLGDLAAELSACLPQDAMLPRDLRRLIEDSRLALSSRPSAPRPGGLRGLRETEMGLRQRVGDSVMVIEQDSIMRTNADLVQMCRDVSASIERQEQIARSYNRSAGDYNNALIAPVSKLVANLFGFVPVAQMYSIEMYQSILFQRDSNT